MDKLLIQTNIPLSTRTYAVPQTPMRQEVWNPSPQVWPINCGCFTLTFSWGHRVDGAKGVWETTQGLGHPYKLYDTGGKGGRFTSICNPQNWDCERHRDSSTLEPGSTMIRPSAQKQTSLLTHIGWLFFILRACNRQKKIESYIQRAIFNSALAFLIHGMAN